MEALLRRTALPSVGHPSRRPWVRPTYAPSAILSTECCVAS